MCILGHCDLSYASVIQVLLFPGGCGDGTVGVHNDLGTADDHDYKEEAEENEASQGQPLVHIHIDRLRSGFLHPAAVTVASRGSGLTGTIFYPCRESQSVKKLGSLVCVSYLQGQEFTAEDPQLRGTRGHSPIPCKQSLFPAMCTPGWWWWCDSESQKDMGGMG